MRRTGTARPSCNAGPLAEVHAVTDRATGSLHVQHDPDLSGRHRPCPGTDVRWRQEAWRYVSGVNHPLEAFREVCVAVIRRRGGSHLASLCGG